MRVLMIGLLCCFLSSLSADQSDDIFQINKEAIKIANRLKNINKAIENPEIAERNLLKFRKLVERWQSAYSEEGAFMAGIQSEITRNKAEIAKLDSASLSEDEKNYFITEFNTNVQNLEKAREIISDVRTDVIEIGDMLRKSSNFMAILLTLKDYEKIAEQSKDIAARSLNIIENKLQKKQAQLQKYIKPTL